MSPLSVLVGAVVLCVSFVRQGECSLQTTPAPPAPCSAYKNCDNCAPDVRCLWCFTTNNCTEYPVSWLLPPASLCPLSQARWGACWPEQDEEELVKRREQFRQRADEWNEERIARHESIRRKPDARPGAPVQQAGARVERLALDRVRRPSPPRAAVTATRLGTQITDSLFEQTIANPIVCVCVCVCWGGGAEDAAMLLWMDLFHTVLQSSFFVF
ncbi:Pituitary tumor-transforming gene 1 protein-interacting protein [Liparis tanakae]|uniref:Pituitary tumor-transforming gene 1 protein-interacting protein n=1 Tax=Liparis tanakae TaxID=230148 RepID=A0A4Z2JEA2_9TELE|nr:Pituitary tumor-transforming gene 1 protein-interacting protein [Liparis tanakae]